MSGSADELSAVAYTIESNDVETVYRVEVGAIAAYRFELNSKSVSGPRLAVKSCVVGAIAVSGMDGRVSNNDSDSTGETWTVVSSVKGAVGDVSAADVYVVTETVMTVGVWVTGSVEVTGLTEFGK